MSTSSVLHAGNCGPDTWALEGLLKELGVAHISSAESIAEVEQLLQSESFTLVLLNRVFDSTGELALDLLGNGVARSMLVDYGDFAVDSRLVQLQALPRPRC